MKYTGMPAFMWLLYKNSFRDQLLSENILLRPVDRIVTVDIKRKTDAATECTKYRQTIYAKPLKDYS
jgi:hypothetical protein